MESLEIEACAIHDVAGARFWQQGIEHVEIAQVPVDGDRIECMDGVVEVDSKAVVGFGQSTAIL